MEKDDRVCEDCSAVGELCGYHAGFGDGWDAAVAAVRQNAMRHELMTK